MSYPIGGFTPLIAYTSYSEAALNPPNAILLLEAPESDFNLLDHTVFLLLAND